MTIHKSGGAQSQAMSGLRCEDFLEPIEEGLPEVYSQQSMEHRGLEAIRKGKTQSPWKGHPTVNSAPAQILVVFPASDLHCLPLNGGG